MSAVNSHHQVVGTVVSTGRLPSSFYGNPTCTITLRLDDGEEREYRNEVDASAGYAVENYRPGDRVVLHFHKRHRVTFFHIDGAGQ